MPSTPSVGILGAGAAGLVTAQVLLKDGFDVQLITRDHSVGGVWARERIYPGLTINNVHGEFRFSSLPMSPPQNAAQTGGRLTGDDMCAYMETFAHKFLEGKIKYQTEIINIHKSTKAGGWLVTVQDLKSGEKEVLSFTHVVLCTGGCSKPKVPAYLSSEPPTPELNVSSCLVFHSSKFSDHLDAVMTKKAVDCKGNQTDASIVIVGGGKSAQDVASYLANAGRNVTVVFETADAYLAYPKPLPEFLRKSRFLGIMSPHIDLKTPLERFLHTTWLGSKIVNFFWNALTFASLSVYSLPKDSPLRNARSMFWGIRTNDEGAYRPNSFHGLVTSGKIQVVAPARVTSLSDDRKSVSLNNGTTLPADVLVLATGFTSSWTGLFDAETSMELGIARQTPTANGSYNWNYQSMSNPPATPAANDAWSSSIYRGLVPAKNIHNRDFAINGAIFTTNNGYSFEVFAHWISSYFLKDRMRLPSTVEEALASAERNSAWMRARHPNMTQWMNESYSSNVAFWTWPQCVDEVLEDMYLPSMRSGGNWLTWPFKVIDLKEIASLGEERRLNRTMLGR